ncbi:hypothetical protein TCAL_11838 [Tigriopus californicus]|uniref:Lipase domain-containing protein n=1 Tax=Tigriopus californicus TaxID=6832 RepID=A0A553NDI1_TIGCA|nr:hypothetical protein TCAL_11838 [Tigriopus californicus]
MCHHRDILNSVTRLFQDRVKFFIWTRDNPGIEDLILPSNLDNDLSASHFKAGLPIKILIHGFSDNGKTDWITNMRDTFLENGDCVVISVDWSVWAGTNIFTYPSAAFHTKKAANVAKLLVDTMINHGASFEDIHVIGFSLGAHVAGYLGQKVQGRLPRVTGLDPAAPLFTLTKNRINRQSARFVDIIHTAGEFTSLESPLGHADFYPNGGVHPQPGCENDRSLDHKRSHFRAYKYYAESIGQPTSFKSISCHSWIDFEFEQCDERSVSYMGDYADPRVQGQFYLATNAEPPYSKNLSMSFSNQSHFLNAKTSPDNSPGSQFSWTFLFQVFSWLD